MLSLHTNSAALSTTSAVTNTQRGLSTSLTRLGTGYRINSAMDDAAGLQIATRLEAQTRGMSVAMRNTQNGISMMQTAEGAFDEVTNILLRMKDLATEAASGSSTTDDRTAMQAEYDALGSELKNIVSNTSFGGEKLFGTGVSAGAVSASKFSSTGGVTFQIGADKSETMLVDITTAANSLTADAGAGSLGAISTTYDSTWTAASTSNELTAANANNTIGLIDAAIAKVSTVRSALGAASNRLDHVYNNLSNMSTNTAAAKSRITDVDYASETANMTSKQLLLQAGTSMLKQSSSMSQLALSLLN